MIFGVDAVKGKKIDKVTARETLEDALNKLTYDFGDGRVIQTRPKDQQNLQGKITVIEAGGSASFIMADDTVHDVTILELQTAIAAGMVAANILWDDYMLVVQA